MAVETGPFPQQALATNQAGRLTDTQRKELRAEAHGVRKSELTAAAFLAAFGLFIFVAVRPSSPALIKLGVPIVCVVIAAVLLARAVTGADRLTRDLRRPRIDSLEGPISKHVVTTSSRGSSSSKHYLDVAGQRFHVWRPAYEAAPEAGFVRIYFLSISRHVVNLEQLPDRSLPEGTTPQAMMQTFKQALSSHDEAKVDAVRAEMAGTEHAMMAGVSHDAVPPPAESRDQRPLQETIQGTWSNGPITVVFSSDGTFAITMLGANERAGNWSVDGDGKLVADFDGRQQATDAWIAGDQLTVSLGGDAITLKRVTE